MSCRLLEAVHVRDVRVIQRRERTSFAFEPREPVGIAGDRIWQHFDRDVSFELAVVGAVHLAHTAATERRDDFIRADPRARGESHLGSGLYLLRDTRK